MSEKKVKKDTKQERRKKYFRIGALILAGLMVLGTVTTVLYAIVAML